MIAVCRHCHGSSVVGSADTPKEPGGLCRRCLLADARCDAVELGLRVGGCTGAAALSVERPGLQVMCCDGGDGESAQQVASFLAGLKVDVDVEVHLTARHRVVSVAAVRVGDQVVALAWVASPLLDSDATDHARSIAVALAQDAQRIGGWT